MFDAGATISLAFPVKSDILIFGYARVFAREVKILREATEC
jgi:hypothetical protein